LNTLELEQRIEIVDLGDPMTTITYLSIMKLINAFFCYMKNRESIFDDSFTTQTIGYRILSSRAHVSFETMKNSPDIKKKIIDLVKQANTSERTYNKKDLPINLENNASDNNSDSSSSDNDEEEDESLEPRQLFESANATKIRSESKTYYTCCCVCGKSKTQFSHLEFYKSPITQQQDLPKDASKRTRFTQTKRAFCEQIYFQRWKVSRLKSTKRLLFCSEHKEEEEYLPIPFKMLGRIETKSDWVKVPKNPQKESTRTRIDSLLRKPYERREKEIKTKQSTRAKRCQPFHHRCNFSGCINKGNDKNVIIMRLPPFR
jgi:hypothetical protein